MKLKFTADDLHILKICFEYTTEQLEKEIKDCGIESELQQLRKEWLTKIQNLERNLNTKVEE